MAEIAVRVAIEVLKKTSGIIGDLIAEEGSRLSRLQEEISWIEREMRHIHSYLKDVEHKQGENERVANLMKDIRGLAFDVEDTMEKYFPILSIKRKGFKGFLKRTTHIFSDYYGAHNFLVEVEAIKRRVEDLNRVRQTYGINEQRSDQASSVERDGWDERRSFLHVQEPNITGFEDHTRNLVAKIFDEDSKLRVISITGMPGLGKTTLAKKVYKSVEQSFTLTAWVYVSEQPIIKNILQNIAKEVGLEKKKWEDGDEAMLYQHLNQKRHLLVIDDIWHTIDWDAIKVAIPTNSENGSRIILTSRNRDVGVHVGGWNSLLELQPLVKSYSKQLFEASLGPVQTENDPPRLKEIGEEILHRCGGVPLAIVVVSGLLKLRVRSIDAWNGVLEQMDQGHNEFSKTFALSYLDLPTNLKPCFLYFGIFPEDHEIDTFELINLWATEGFIKGSRVREVEDVGADYLNHLIARNLIQVVQKDPDRKVKSCRIHDILHSLCILQAKDIDFFIGSADLTCFNGKAVRRVTAHGMSLNDHISLNCQTPKLRSFLCFYGYYSDSPKVLDFCKDLNLVRVLHLENIFGPTQFLEVIWSLKNLTYLKLQIYDHMARIKGGMKIPESIIILESLVTLDIDINMHGGILIFPMVIWNMKQLRHLLLQNEHDGVRCTYKGFDPNVIPFQNFQTLVLPYAIFEADWLHKLSKVRTLKFKYAFIEGRCSEEKITKLLLSSNLVLNKLETLSLKNIYRNRLPMIAFKMVGYQNLSNLCLAGVDIEQWSQPDELPQNLTEIVLTFCNLKEDPFVVMKKMPKLGVLKLLFCRYALGELVCTGEPGNFPQLEQLHIMGREIPKITIEDGGMPRLKEFALSRGNHQLKLPTRIYQILRVKSDIQGVNKPSRLKILHF